MLAVEGLAEPLLSAEDHLVFLTMYIGIVYLQHTCGAVWGRGGCEFSNLAFMYSRSAAAVLPAP